MKLTTLRLRTETKSLPSCPEQQYSEGLIALSFCQTSRAAGIELGHNDEKK